MIVSFLSCGKKNSSGMPERGIDPITGSDYLSLVNQYRMHLGLNSLKNLQAITTTAYSHSDLMASGRRRFGHTGWRQRCDYLKQTIKASSCGEIVAKGQMTSADVLDSWVSSPLHREAIERPDWTHTGYAQVFSKDGVPYWTEIFVRID